MNCNTVLPNFIIIVFNSIYFVQLYYTYFLNSINDLNIINLKQLFSNLKVFNTNSGAHRTHYYIISVFQSYSKNIDNF